MVIGVGDILSSESFEEGAGTSDEGPGLRVTGVSISNEGQALPNDWGGQCSLLLDGVGICPRSTRAESKPTYCVHGVIQDKFISAVITSFRVSICTYAIFL